MRPVAARRRIFRAPVLCIGLAGAAKAGRGEAAEPLKFPDAQYKPVAWSDLDGWAKDDHAAFATFLDSCCGLGREREPSRQMAQVPAALRHVCARAGARTAR